MGYGNWGMAGKWGGGSVGGRRGDGVHGQRRGCRCGYDWWDRCELLDSIDGWLT